MSKIGNALRSTIGSVMARFTSEPRNPDEHRVSHAGRTTAGVYIDPDTAVTVPAVWACLRYLSQTVAVCPWHVMQDSPSGGVLAKSHTVDWLLWKRPNDEWSSFQFRETLTHWALRWGNGYAEIERDQLGRPYALWPIHPDRVKVERDLVTGRLVYEVSNGTGGKVVLDQMDMFHIRGFGEGPVGVNVIAYAAESIGWARAVQLFGAAFFGNGMNVNGVVQQTGKVGEDSLKRTVADLENKHKGVRRALKTLFIPVGLEWKATSVEPNKGQFIETSQHLVSEICRWFGVPNHKVADLTRSTNNNIEHQGIEAVVDSISPWVKRFEDEADFKLFGRQNRRGFYTKINMNALMRGDVKSRGEYYKMMRETGAFSANRILQLEDENTIGPDGDKHVIQSQYTTLERIGEEAPAGDASPPDPALPPPDEQAAQAALQSLALMLEAEHVE